MGQHSLLVIVPAVSVHRFQCAACVEAFRGTVPRTPLGSLPSGGTQPDHVVRGTSSLHQLPTAAVSTEATDIFPRSSPITPSFSSCLPGLCPSLPLSRNSMLRDPSTQNLQYRASGFQPPPSPRRLRATAWPGGVCGGGPTRKREGGGGRGLWVHPSVPVQFLHYSCKSQRCTK